MLTWAETQVEYIRLLLAYSEQQFEFLKIVKMSEPALYIVFGGRVCPRQGMVKIFPLKSAYSGTQQNRAVHWIRVLKTFKTKISRWLRGK